MQYTEESLAKAIIALGWDTLNDNIAVEIGGTVVSGIHQGEDYNKKWATPYGVRKYNKDAFIVIKNLDRNPTISSQPFPEGEFKPAHSLTEKKENA